MRIRRIRLSNYRGIDKRELVFAGEEEVTIVQGPNEVGKSCISEAVDILFDCRDDSRARRVLSTQPVGRDVATEIELELETGPYVLTYRKRFHRDRKTELEVRAPAPESWTGREAHDRARQILEETVDVALWKALRIHQGMAVSQANVGQNTSLAAALDHAAGGLRGSSSDENESLFEAVTEEFLRYYTATGRERRELGVMRAALEVAEERTAELVGKCRSLDGDVLRCTHLVTEGQRLALRDVELAEEVGRWHGELEVLKTLGEEAEGFRLRWEKARETLTLSRERVARRQEGTRRLAELMAESDRIGAELLDLERSTERIRSELLEAEASLQRLLAAEGELRGAAEAARVDFEHWSEREELEELGRRKERIAQARAEAADAQRLLATSRVTTHVVDRIREAYNELLVTRAVLQSKSPSLEVQVISDVELEVGNERIQLRAGDVREDAITAPLDLAVPGLLRLVVRPGEDLAEVRRKLDSARNTYMTACQEIGVEDLETALELLKQRQQAEAKVAERDRTMRTELGEGWTEALEARQEELRRRVFLHVRESGGGNATDRETARTAARSAEENLEHVRSQRESTNARIEALRARGEEISARRRGLGARAEILVSEVHAAQSEVGDVDGRSDQADLEGSATEAAAHEEELRAGYERVRAELEKRAPDALRERAANAEAALAKVRRELREVETQHTEVATRVKLLSEEGLAERFDRSETERLHLATELDRLESRARAAAMLFHTLRKRREEARAAYVQPLTDRVESLGRIVFGADFEVELDDDLRVRNRTLGGQTLPFDSLSTGTREQIGIITRLACAMIVAEDGSGVPLILDDALGYSDPERLREMGAVLAVAGRRLQVILLTSVPDRYLHVGGAQVVRL